MFPFLFPLKPRDPVAKTELRDYLIETFECDTKGCSAPYHTRLTFTDPWDGEKVRLLGHVWDHHTFLAAINAHHRIVRAVLNREGNDWETVSRETCTKACDIDALFGLPKQTYNPYRNESTVSGTRSLLEAFVRDRLIRDFRIDLGGGFPS